MYRSIKIFVLMVVFFAAACPAQADGISPSGAQFVKLDSNGQRLPGDAAEWAMVLDSATGLIWEVKTTDGSIHDMQAGYDWEGAHDVFLARLNTMKFGGFSDWRLPTTEELRTLRVDGGEPNINRDFFPHTVPSSYMSWRKCGSGEIFDEQIKFGKIRSKKTNRHVRAVRWGGALAAGKSE
ncbi:MAG: DUF1566 domain-containing protein [Desulfobulbaceae bacterium]|nr:DUF1566 domain-containing protein [Desulfobulbaceae bacterium]